MDWIVNNVIFLIISVLTSLCVIAVSISLLSVFFKTNRFVESLKKGETPVSEAITKIQHKRLLIISIAAMAVRTVCYLLFHNYLKGLTNEAFIEHPYCYTFEILLYKYPLVIWFASLLFMLYQINLNLKTIYASEENHIDRDSSR